MQLIVLPLQFRNAKEMLSTRKVDLAVTVAEELPPGISRLPLLSSDFSCVFDPRFARIGKRLDERTYFAHEHVVVSYAGDLRGIIEDLLGKQRKVRVSVPAFASVCDVVQGSPLLSTIPRPFAQHMLLTRPELRALPLPFPLVGPSLDLLWPRAVEQDPVSRFMRELLEQVSGSLASSLARRPGRAVTRSKRALRRASEGSPQRTRAGRSPRRK